ncbi:MAG: SpoIIE family protein phosphatase, partial [Erysipelotrichaceae bacterium]|nr:SpoIIE family protein phosphatase [Erysipelotrichaceae bacterium]
DFFLIDNDHLCLVIADVSGKGIPAAMFMVIAKTLIKDHTQLGLQPDDVFTRVNRILCDGNEAGMFVTAWMGVLDLRDGKMVYVNAGHNPPVVKLDGKLQFLHSKPGFIMAGLEDYRYTMSELQLKKGDMIFLYTDGVTEATNLDQELYGEKRLLECLGRQTGKNCAGILRAVREDVDDFVGEAEQFDDLTMLVFDYSQKDSKHMTAERTFDASDDKLHDVLSFVEEELEKHDVSMKTMMAINVAVEEIFVNIAHYAYEGRPGKAVVGMNFDEDNVHIYLVDNGIPFNPLEMKDPDITAGVDEREIGGLGIYMVKKSMDKCTYERRNNQNVFVMRKAIR